MRPPRIARGLGALALLAHAALMAAGLAWMLWAWVRFRAAGTTIRPTLAPSRLVDDGPFAWGRNPMYLGIAVAMLGLGVALGVPFMAAAALVFVALMQRVHIGAFYNVAAETALVARPAEIRARLAQLELALGQGPYFAGESFSIVDAVFGPVLRYFDAIDDFGFCIGLPKVHRWRLALATRPSVAEAVRPDDPQLLGKFLLARHSALSRRIALAGAAA